MDTGPDNKTILESGFAAVLARQLAAAAEAAASAAPPARAGRRPRRWLLVASAVAVLVAAATVIAVVPSLRPGAGHGYRIAGSSPSVSPSRQEARPAPIVDNVTTISQLSLDASAQPWISGRLGETQPAYAAYLSGGAWRRLPIPARLKNLHVLAALSPRDAWATVSGAIAHWDGSAWREASLPWLDGNVASLDAMAVAATNDVWAVGDKAGPLYHAPHDPGTRYQGELPLTMHWDGSAWAKVPVPPSPGHSAMLDAVSSRGAETWAVGWYERGLPREPLRRGPIALRWDGERWLEMALPNTSGGGTTLLDVLVLGRNDVWVLGMSNRDGVGATYLARWDGMSWRRVATPRGRAWGNFTSVAGTADDDLWLGGSGADGLDDPQAAHWDGQRWTVYRSAAFPSRQSAAGQASGELGEDEPQITAASPSDVWFNASFTRFWYSASSDDQRQIAASASDPMLFHWDGRSWSKVQIGF